MFQRIHTRAANSHLAFKQPQQLLSHASSRISPLPRPLHFICSLAPGGGATHTQPRRPRAGKTSRDHWARLLEDYSRSNPVLLYNTGQVLFGERPFQVSESRNTSIKPLVNLVLIQGQKNKQTNKKSLKHQPSYMPSYGKNTFIHAGVSDFIITQFLLVLLSIYFYTIYWFKFVLNC